MPSFAQFDWDATLLHATWEIPTHLWATSQLNSIQFGSQRPKSPKLTALRGNQNQTVMAWIYLLIVQHCGYHTVLTHSPAPQQTQTLALSVDGGWMLPLRHGGLDSPSDSVAWPHRSHQATSGSGCTHLCAQLDGDHWLLYRHGWLLLGCGTERGGGCRTGTGR
jgi:hypothetical protein